MTAPDPVSGLRILYVAELGGTAAHRAAALTRLGHAVTPFDVSAYLGSGGRLAAWLRLRTLRGPVVARLNRDLLALARTHAFDVVWCDKAQLLRPATVRQLARGGARVVHYSSDLPSAVRGEAGWRLFRQAVPEYAAVVAPSVGHDAEYRALGARRILHMPFGYEPGVHYPPPPTWGEAERRADVVFIGTPYGQRAAFLLALAREHGVSVEVIGDRWDRVLDADALARLNWRPGRYGAAYRETIWRARICLGFVTHEMAHASARRWTEIAACGGFLLAERTADAEAWFEADAEAAFFSDVADCAARIRRYLDDPAARDRVARAGRARVAERFANETLLAGVLARLMAGGDSA